MSYKFTKGSKVEVLNLRELHLSSWLCAKIISGNGHTYTVCYDHYVPEIGGTDERVRREAIRPCPPLPKRPVSLKPGETVEILYKRLWKPAKVLSVDDEGDYMVTLLETYGELIVHETEVRQPQSWQNGKWVMKQKESDKHINGKVPPLTEEGCGSNELHQDFIGKKRSRSKFEMCEKDAKKRRVKKERRIKKLVTNDVDCIDAESACFGSFGTNKLHPDDAKTSSGAGREQFCPTSKQMEPEIHRLESDAYRATLIVLHAYGPLSWEAETLITDLRRMLNISNDEHLSEIRKLVSHSNVALVRL